MKSLSTFLLLLGLALATGCGSSQSNSAGPGHDVLQSFVDPTAQIEGELQLSDRVYVAPFAQMLLGGGSLSIGKGSNVQDNVAIISAPDRQVVIGEKVIIAHGASVVGPAILGASQDDPSFVGFNALVEGAILEPGSMVGIMARVGPGVILRRGWKVKPGRNVTTQQEADDPQLGKVEAVVPADFDFMNGVLHVNEDLAIGYSRMQNRPDDIRGISLDPNSPLHPRQVLPTLAGRPTRLPLFRNRIIGEVYLDDTPSELSRKMGNRDSLRADEGGPFRLGRLGQMSDEVTFHALEHSEITVGNDCRFGQRVLIHGGEDRANRPPQRTLIGDRVVVESGAVVFRSTLGDGVVIGARAVIDGCNLQPGQVVPAGRILINNQESGQTEW